MKQFSLEEYLKNPSRKVVTRDGRPVRIICTDAKIYYSVIALIEEDGVEHVFSYLPDGSVGSDTSSKYDLFFDIEKKDGWVNLFLTVGKTVISGTVFNTKDEALENAEKVGRSYKYIDTIQIQWEE